MSFQADYKITALKPGKDDAFLKTKYEKQLSIYAGALEKLSIKVKQAVLITWQTMNPLTEFIIVGLYTILSKRLSIYGTEAKMSKSQSPG